MIQLQHRVKLKYYVMSHFRIQVSAPASFGDDTDFEEF